MPDQLSDQALYARLALHLTPAQSAWVLNNRDDPEACMALAYVQAASVRAASVVVGE